jgi:Arc/MetJ-type ribon-helix-helix transcriptional regulator
MVAGMTEQIAVRLPDELLNQLDELIDLGRYPSRAAAVRAAVEIITMSERARRLDQEIMDGYRAHPPNTDEQDAAMASMRAAIAEEPW